jgi:hypothetical protein
MFCDKLPCFLGTPPMTGWIKQPFRIGRKSFWCFIEHHQHAFENTELPEAEPHSISLFRKPRILELGKSLLQNHRWYFIAISHPTSKKPVRGMGLLAKPIALEDHPARENVRRTQ